MPSIADPTIEVSPSILDQLDDQFSAPWVVILYNDDWHPMDQVVFQLQKATGCSLEQAHWIMLEAHMTGRAVAYTGAYEECNRVLAILLEIRLQVELDRA